MHLFLIRPFSFFSSREAPEPTGEEADDADLDAPKIYELVGEPFSYIKRRYDNLAAWN